jgi:hypothetical protein
MNKVSALKPREIVPILVNFGFEEVQRSRRVIRRRLKALEALGLTEVQPTYGKNRDQLLRGSISRGAMKEGADFGTSQPQ